MIFSCCLTDGLSLDFMGKEYDVIVIGSGIGGLTAALLLAQQGFKVLVLESNYLPGGCCSSYWRKGYIFETGATTLMGFDTGHPLALLEQRLGITFSKKRLDPAMTVWLDGKKIIRPQSFDEWLGIVIETFGNASKQTAFWKKAYELSEFVWKVSGKNLDFPPDNLTSILQLAINNSPRDVFKLRYAFRSVYDMVKTYGLDQDKAFLRFLDEQLLITAQSVARDTPFLFAAPALCYTNYANYYMTGGMISLPFQMIEHLGGWGGDLRLRKKVVKVTPEKNKWHVNTSDGETFITKKVLSNVPIWNIPDLLDDSHRTHFQKQADAITDYWGAFTMGIVINDVLPADFTLHHQIILPEGEEIVFCKSKSVFISISDREDTFRAPNGERVLALSTHVLNPNLWFHLSKTEYDSRKHTIVDQILKIITDTFPALTAQDIVYYTASTPVSWQEWIERKDGSVGGIPQSMSRPLWKWMGANTPQIGIYLCGDTIYPGQGIPGVTLGGIIAAKAIAKDL